MISEIAIKTLGEGVKARIIQEWKAQGHSMNGAFEKSITYEAEGNTITWGGKYYGRFIEYGVNPEDIKYKFAKKRINALQKYAEIKLGLPTDTAKSVAYAIAQIGRASCRERV